MSSNPEVYSQVPYGQPVQPGQPVMYPGAAVAPQPVAYAPAPAPMPAPMPAPVQPLHLGPSSTMCVCPACHATITTTTVYEAGGLCWLICLLLCVFGFVLGCCLIPFCINECKDVVHKCPNCNALIGKYTRL